MKRSEAGLAAMVYSGVAECLLESVSHLGWVGVVVARSGDVGLTGALVG